jgi:S-adenosylmethionine:tRNA ribosyltransferase-isomerase
MADGRQPERREASSPPAVPQPGDVAASEAVLDDDPAGTTAWFDYHLPPERIAQEPVEPRDAARLVVDRPGHRSLRRSNAPAGPAGPVVDEAEPVVDEAKPVADGVAHRRVADLPDLLDPGDLVVVNDTRVAPARLRLTKPTGGRVEVLLLEPTGEPRRWQALVRGGRRVRPGTPLQAEGETMVVVGDDLGDGRRLVELVVDDAMHRVGHVPLPPYIHRELADESRYQTVFANVEGSVAAPTAGLHLTTDVLDRLAERQIDVVRVELRVGLGTFRPITAERVVDHHMHAEWYRVSAEVWERIRAAPRVVAVGTTVVRTLESVAATGELEGTTELFISRGFEWRVVDTLLTNFHVPRSSLLVLVDAFIGDRWRDLYRIALDEGYRFLSFGDAMLVDRRHPGHQ